jgi:hypothetical protein
LIDITKYIGSRGFAYIWLLVFTLIYDVVERRTQSNTFHFLLVPGFLFYTGYHMLLGLLATWVLTGSVTLDFLAGLVAAISTETILANADIKFGAQSLLPLGEQFSRLRAKINEELAQREEGETTVLHGRLAKCKLGILHDELTMILVRKNGAAACKKQIEDLKAVAGADETLLKSALASELLLFNREYIRQKIRAWEKKDRQAG